LHTNVSLNEINAVDNAITHTHDRLITKFHLLDLTSKKQKRTKNAVDHITSSKNKPNYLTRIKKNYIFYGKIFRKNSLKNRMHFDQTSPKKRNPQQQKKSRTATK